MLGFHVNRLGVSGGVTERLHHQVGLEAQASQIFQLVTGHRASGVLGAHGGHLRLAVHAGANTVHAAGLADHFLGQSEALVGITRLFRLAEQFGRCQTQRFASLGGQAATDDQVDTAAGAHFVQQNLGAQVEFSDDFTVFFYLACERVNVDHVTGVHFFHVTLERQGTGIFHGVEEDRSDLAADADAAGALVRYERNVVTEVPQYGVGSRFTGRTGTHNVAHVGNRMAFFLQLVHLAQRADFTVFFRGDTFARIFQHGVAVQRDIRAAPGVLCRRQIISVGFTGNLEY